MHILKKSLSATVAEDGKNWDLFFSAVALAHNSTPRVAIEFPSPLWCNFANTAALKPVSLRDYSAAMFAEAMECQNCGVRSAALARDIAPIRV